MKIPPLQQPVAMLEPLHARLRPAEAEAVVAFLTQSVVRKRLWTERDTQTVFCHAIGSALPLPPELIVAIAGHLSDLALPPLSAVFYTRLGRNLGHVFSETLARAAQLTATQPETGWPRKLLQFARKDADPTIRLTPDDHIARCLISGVRHFVQIPAHMNGVGNSITIALDYAANQLLTGAQSTAMLQAFTGMLVQQAIASTVPSSRGLLAAHTFSPEPGLGQLTLMTPDERIRSNRLLEGSACAVATAPVPGPSWLTRLRRLFGTAVVPRCLEPSPT